MVTLFSLLAILRTRVTASAAVFSREGKRKKTTGYEVSVAAA